MFFIPDGQYQHSEVEHLTERRKNGGTHCGDNRLIYLNRFCVKTTPTLIFTPQNKKKMIYRSILVVGLNA